MKRVVYLLCLLFAFLLPVASFAQASDMRTLVIKGKIQKTNSTDHKTYSLSFKEIEALGLTTVESKNEFATESHYSGPLVRDILKFVGADQGSKEVIFTGADGYKVRAPIADFKKYEVVIAHTLDGQRLTEKTKGPFWVMYPTEKYKADLINATISSRMVWNLVAIEVR